MTIDGAMLELRGIRKSFGSNHVLKGVDLRVLAGEVHVLFGENGAGKSTLINIITGMFGHDGGSVRFRGNPCNRLTAGQARSLGIATVFQEFSLVPSLSVADNLFLGRELSRFSRLRRGAMAARAKAVLADLQFDLDPSAIVGTLPRAEQQMVEIAKAMMGEASLLILDEPTASLTDTEADKVLETVRRLAARGISVIYVSHRMREIRAIADRITVLRAGVSVATLDMADADEDRLVEMMIGRSIDSYFPQIGHKPGDALLSVSNLTTTGHVNDVSLELRAGEIVGLAGLVGCGKGEIGRAIYGLEPIIGGRIVLAGKHAGRPRPDRMLKRGLCYFPADRNAEGLCLDLGVSENVAIASGDLRRFSGPGGVIRHAAERTGAREAMERLSLRPLTMGARVRTYSGGNRQKVMLGRALMRDLDVYIFDEPTVGIDVGAKVEVYEFMRELVERGAAVLLISSELIEVSSLSNRVYVVCDGRIATELRGDEATQENILAAFFEPGTRAKLEKQN